MAEQGSTGNVIAALCSFFIPGLGQLTQGRPFVAFFFFIINFFFWLIWLGWIIHLISALEAAWYKR